MNMKMVLVFALALVVLPTISLASTLSCAQVDGMAIFGYDGSEWIHIGAIGNEYNSLSIANDYGAGSEYKSTSILNDYGRYGGDYGSYSAFNDYASKPPIIINDDYKFVGYLTTGYKTPSINTYEAIACANNSFRSPNRDMQDITFKSIPSSSSYSSGGGDYPSEIADICPANSTYTGTGCTCNSGYVADGNHCITATQGCQKQYGPNSYGDNSYCYCSDGYQFNAEGTYCYPKPDPTCPSGYLYSRYDKKCIQNSQSFSVSTQPSTLKDEYAGLTSDERCVELGFGTFYNTDKQSCDTCPVGTERVTGINICQAPSPPIEEAVPVVETKPQIKTPTPTEEPEVEVATEPAPASSTANNPTNSTLLQLATGAATLMQPELPEEQLQKQSFVQKVISWFASFFQ